MPSPDAPSPDAPAPDAAARAAGSPAIGPVHRTDVAIVGAGPVGLFAVFQCGMLGLRCHVVDSLDTVGGQCAALYPEKPIYDIPAWPRLTGAELVARLDAQAAPFAPAYHLGQTVVGLERTASGGFLLATDAGTRIEAAAVFLAAGAGAFGPNRPPLDGIEAFEGSSVFYAVHRIEDFAGRRVVVAGGGDSAVDWAVALADTAAKVFVVHRRDRFRAAPEMVRRLHEHAADGRVELVVPFQLAAVEGEAGRLSSVTVATLDGETRRLDADMLLPFFGLATSLGPIARWGVAIERHRIPVDPATCRTDQPRLFAIGDVATYPGKLKLILCGFSEAAMAAHAAFAVARPGETLHFEHSTTKGVPGPEG